VACISSDKGLGKSPTAIKYAIQSKQEAEAYINHPVLGPRLIEISEAFMAIEGKTANEILDSPDDIKMKSCMTLFNLVSDNPILQKVIDKYYEGEQDVKTLEIINSVGKG